jgi:hypothetical protein
LAGTRHAGLEIKAASSCAGKQLSVTKA